MERGSPASLRRANRLAVLRLLLNHGPMRQAEIARASHLSTSTVSAIVAEARQQGLVTQTDVQTPSADRRGSAVTFNPNLGYVIGIDIGQSSTRVALGDLAYQPIAVETVRSIVNLQSDEAAQRIFQAAQQLILSAKIDDRRIIGIGISMPSPQDAVHRTIEGQQIFPGWTGDRVGQELGSLFEKPVFIENDADAAALAESRWGAGRGVSSFLHVLTHAGIGSGIVLDGRIYRGATRRAGEIGHISVDPDGSLCYCGNRGCLQTVAGGDAVAAALRPFLGPDTTLEDVVHATRAGDRTAHRALHDAGRLIGRALGHVANVLNPEKIVIGGYFLLTGDAFLTPLRAEFEVSAMPGVADAMLVRSELDEDAWARASLGIVPIDLEAVQEMQE